MLYHLALEPYEERYTADWYRWFQKEYRRAKIPFQYVDGQALTDRIETGRFLDVYNTNYWKMTQMAELVKLFRAGVIRDGDLFLTADLWHPGLECIRYMADLTKTDVKLFGILHAGTYDPNDFTAQAGLEDWARWHETGWLAQCDKVFVGSAYHHNLLARTRCRALPGLSAEKVVVTGLPFYADELRIKYGGVQKDPNLVVFPHRLDPEKQPWLSEKLSTRLPSTVTCVRTKDVCQTKDEYYRLLAKATVAVSFAKQETFGYAMLEATALGCQIVVPDRLSYKSMYPSSVRYEDFEHAVVMVRSCLAQPMDVQEAAASEMAEIVSDYQHSISRMIDEMLEVPD